MQTLSVLVANGEMSRSAHAKSLMPRPRNIEPSVRLSCWLPEPLHARLLLEAYSPLHGKTAPGGLTAIVSAALTLYFAQKDALPNVQS